ncbi:YcxB family protein [Klebsiella aerogenes]|uniref:YcxB family protein n=1 Tax=Klebsiella aerogenes TaxID=548 RepID=UPI002E31DDB7|nr:YcxB family protein [Klebsiella aerogenes]MED7793111.1 YcxB family protein [Klebsiella aerogenes]
MIRKNRISIRFTMSVLERTEAAKSIKTYKKEMIKPYEYIDYIKNTGLIVLLFAVLTTLLQLLDPFTFSSSDVAHMEKQRVLSLIAFGLFALAIGTLYIYDAVMTRVAKKRDAAEQADDELLQVIKLNRFFVENISAVSIGRVYWRNVKTSYRRDGFIFIHLLNDSCLVIPDRALESEEEAVEITEFIRTQIATHKKLIA